MERRTLQFWIKWEPNAGWWGSLKILTFPVYKHLLKTPKVLPKYGLCGLAMKAYNPFPVQWVEHESLWRKWRRTRKEKRWLSIFKDEKRNPLPANFLWIPTLHPESTHFKLDLHQFLKSFGHYLTSLEIVEVKSLTRTRMYNVLQQLPNLKALTIHNFYNDTPDYFNKAMDKLFPPPPPSPNPHLTYLRIGNGISEKGPWIVKWLVDILAPQLVSLLVSSVDVEPLDDSSLKNLTTLEITNPLESQFVFKAPLLTFPLQHLSIYSADDKISIWEILNYIDRFANSLISCCTDFREIVFFADPADIKETRKACSFQKLEKLVLSFSGRDKLFRANCFRDQFVLRFQNLKRLELRIETCERVPPDDAQVRVMARERCERERLWHIFPKLEMIEMQMSNDRFCPVIVILKRWEWKLLLLA